MAAQKGAETSPSPACKRRQAAAHVEAEHQALGLAQEAAQGVLSLVQLGPLDDLAKLLPVLPDCLCVMGLHKCKH